MALVLARTAARSLAAPLRASTAIRCSSAVAAERPALLRARAAGEERERRDSWQQAGTSSARWSAGASCAALGFGLVVFQLVANAEAPEEHAEPLTGLKYPHLISVPETPKKHVFVGCGCRLMTPLKVKAYTIGLYADEAGLKKAVKEGKGAAEALGTEAYEKTVRLVMARDVDGTHLAKGFDRSMLKRIRTAAKEGKEGGKEALRKFNNLFRGRNLPSGTEVTLSWLAGGRMVTAIGGQHVGTIESEALCWAIFDMYCGPKAVSNEAREGIAAGLAALGHH
eukprot:tig00021127_g18734.t1